MARFNCGLVLRAASSFPGVTTAGAPRSRGRGAGAGAGPCPPPPARAVLLPHLRNLGQLHAEPSSGKCTER